MRSFLSANDMDEILPDTFNMKRLSTGITKVVIKINETNTIDPAILNPIGNTLWGAINTKMANRYVLINKG